MEKSKPYYCDIHTVFQWNIWELQYYGSYHFFLGLCLLLQVGNYHCNSYFICSNSEQLIQFSPNHFLRLMSQDIRLLSTFLFPFILPLVSNLSKEYLVLLITWLKYCSFLFSTVVTISSLLLNPWSTSIFVTWSIQDVHSILQ